MAANVGLPRHRPMARPNLPVVARRAKTGGDAVFYDRYTDIRIDTGWPS